MLLLIKEINIKIKYYKIELNNYVLLDLLIN
jgi:hypothetical protein